jgi:hypothetical protein
MWYTVDGLPSGANAAAFCPPPPPVVTDAADSSMGWVTSQVTMISSELAPPPAALSPRQGTMGDPGQETGVLAREHWIATPAVGFCSYVPIRNNEMLPVPAIALPNPVNGYPLPVASKRPRFTGHGQVAWPRAFQRFAPIAGTGNG